MAACHLHTQSLPHLCPAGDKFKSSHKQLKSVMHWNDLRNSKKCCIYNYSFIKEKDKLEAAKRKDTSSGAWEGLNAKLLVFSLWSPGQF